MLKVKGAKIQERSSEWDLNHKLMTAARCVFSYIDIKQSQRNSGAYKGCL